MPSTYGVINVAAAVEVARNLAVSAKLSPEFLRLGQTFAKLAFKLSVSDARRPAARSRVGSIRIRLLALLPSALLTTAWLLTLLLSLLLALCLLTSLLLPTLLLARGSRPSSRSRPNLSAAGKCNPA